MCPDDEIVAKMQQKLKALQGLTAVHLSTCFWNLS